MGSVKCKCIIKISYFVCLKFPFLPQRNTRGIRSRIRISLTCRMFELVMPIICVCVIFHFYTFFSSWANCFLINIIFYKDIQPCWMKSFNLDHFSLFDPTGNLFFLQSEFPLVCISCNSFWIHWFYGFIFIISCNLGKESHITYIYKPHALTCW